MVQFNENALVLAANVGVPPALQQRLFAIPFLNNTSFRRAVAAILEYVERKYNFTPHLV